jgi:hypothetical protein
MHLLAKIDTQATEFSPIELSLHEINAHAGGKNFTLAMKAIKEFVGFPYFGISKN